MNTNIFEQIEVHKVYYCKNRYWNREYLLVTTDKQKAKDLASKLREKFLELKEPNKVDIETMKLVRVDNEWFRVNRVTNKEVLQLCSDEQHREVVNSNNGLPFELVSLL